MTSLVLAQVTMSMFRNAVWFMKGMREYTASGYTAASAKFTDADLEVECSGEATQGDTT